jgi:hypothetical protein
MSAKKKQVKYVDAVLARWVNEKANHALTDVDQLVQEAQQLPKYKRKSQHALKILITQIIQSRNNNSNNNNNSGNSGTEMLSDDSDNDEGDEDVILVETPVSFPSSSSSCFLPPVFFLLHFLSLVSVLIRSRPLFARLFSSLSGPQHSEFRSS